MLKSKGINEQSDVRWCERRTPVIYGWGRLLDSRLAFHSIN